MLYSSLSLAEEDCTEEPVCVSLLKDGGKFTVLITNKSTQVASAEFEWQLENARHDNSQSESDVETVVVDAGETKTVTTLRVVNRYKPARYGYSYKWVLGDLSAKHDDAHLYRLPYKPGTQQYVSQSCKGRMSHNRNSNENAIDFSMRIGTAIHAARAGKVIELHQVSISGGTSEMHLDKANFVRLQHSDGTIANYVHLRTMGVKVNIGDEVEAGQFIGYSGDTGYTSGPHLHFEVRQTTSVEHSHTVAVKWKTARGTLVCPRRGLALKAV